MGKTNRAYQKRAMAQAVNHLQQAAEDIIPLELQFRPVHPDLANYLAYMLTGIDAVLKVIGAFCVKSWGAEPDDWDTWRNPGINPPKPDTDG